MNHDESMNQTNIFGEKAFDMILDGSIACFANSLNHMPGSANVTLCHACGVIGV